VGTERSEALPLADPSALHAEELRDVREALTRGRTGWIGVGGPAGVGRTSFLARVVSDSEALVLRGAPLSAEDLLRDFRGMLRDRLGELPRPTGPGFLPEPGGEPGWRTLLLGLADRAGERGSRILLVFDDWDTLVSVRRQFAAELSEALERAGRRGGALVAILSYRSGLPDTEDAPPGGDVLPPPLLQVRLGHLSLREAGRLQGGGDPTDAFYRWAVLGGRSDQLPPRGYEAASWETAAIERILDPAGDLHDRPLRRLQAEFQRPERYGAVLRALAVGPMDWASLVAKAGGVERGGQMAPYLQRLERTGWVTAVRPLGSAPNSRNRRYRLSDPFASFWFSCVLPFRHELLYRPAREVWITRIVPALEAHMDRWLPVAALDWFTHHAAERFPAPAREVGSLWGDDGEFPVVAWLTNGQICYVHTTWSLSPVPDEDTGPDTRGLGAFEGLEKALRRTRYGIGREARTPVLVTPGPVGPEVRRRMARTPLARLLAPEELMGGSA